MCLLKTLNVVGYTSFQLYIFHLVETLLARLVFLRRYGILQAGLSFLRDIFLRDFV